MTQKYTPSYLSRLLIFYLLCIIVVIIWFAFTPYPEPRTSLQITKLSQPTPTPTPIKLPAGKGTYAVSLGAHTGPSIDIVSFDPLDVRKGQTITITVQIASNRPADAVEGSLVMDTTTRELSFTRTQKTNVFELWQTTISIDDTLWYTYTLRVRAQNASGTSNLTITPR
jgi:hypothetical protein